VHKAKIKLTQEELDAYDKAYRLIDLNGRGQIILLNLLLALI
jgi:Ca2+-binding EF-hand superfamily protein